MTLLICLAQITMLSSMIMVGPRVANAMGEDIRGLRFLAARNKRGVPVRAILIQSSVAIFLALTSAFNVILTSSVSPLPCLPAWRSWACLCFA